MYPCFYGQGRPRPRRIIEQQFGLGLSPNDILNIMARPHRDGRYYRVWRTQVAKQDNGSVIKQSRHVFQVSLDVQHFDPEDVVVKMACGFLIIEAYHRERQDDHGFITRSFTRRYKLPVGVIEDAISSSLSSDGVLTVTAPRRVPTASIDEKIIPIVQVGPVIQPPKEPEEGGDLKKAEEEQG